MLILKIFVAIINTALGILVGLHQNSLRNWSFAIFAISSGAWIITMQLAVSLESPQLGYIAFFIPIILLGALSTFSYTLRKTSRLWLMPVLVLGTVILLLSPTLLLVKSVLISNGTISAVYGPLIILHRVYILTTIILSLILIARAMKNDKLMAWWLISSIGIFVILASITNMFLPQLVNNNSYNQLGPLFSIFMVAGIAYAITRYQLLDIRIVLQRGLIYLSLTTIIGITFSVSLFITEHLLGEYMNITHSISGVFTTLLGINLGPRLLNYFTEKTNSLFYKDPYRFKEAIVQIDHTMRTHLDRHAFIQNFITTINTILKPEFVHIICLKQKTLFDGTTFSDPSDTYSELVLDTLTSNRRTIRFCKKTKIPVTMHAMQARHNTQIVFPIQTDTEILATVCLGRRKSGDNYINRDIKLLKIATNYASIALKNIQFYEQQKQYTKKLEKRVAKRTCELEELQQSQKQSMLDISHGIQNPLTLLRAELETEQLRLSNNGDMYDKFILLVDKTSKLAYELVTLARLNTLPKQNKHKDVNLTVILNNCMTTLNVTANRKDIHIHYKADDNIFVNASAGDMQRLIMNLVKNAIKYTSISTGEKSIHITLLRNMKINSNNPNTVSSGSVKFTVSDTGIGIPSGSIPKLFDTFYRVDNTINVEGAGIGLTIVKRIVDTHNGIIGVESTAGSGSKFTITLPTILSTTAS